ncbi:MAG: GGDEF and EAL domain-containing protein [Roseburia sp.]|nr:GGDEF and EAL domain-containing protein [Roseburia sp.]
MEYQGHVYEEITVQQFCQVIDLLHPCMDDYLYIYDFHNDFFYISPSAVERFSMPTNCFHNASQTYSMFIYPKDYDNLKTDFKKHIKENVTFHNLEHRLVDKNGKPLWVNYRGYVVRNRENEALYIIGCANEIGRQQKADNVSGLLSESSLHNYLEDSRHQSGVLIRLGLDDFKEINEKLGMEYGDLILRKTAECITACTRPSQQLYRIVADEFIIMDKDCNSTEEAISLFEKIQTTIHTFVEENQYEASYTISGGILTWKHNTENTYSNMMKLSEFALQKAKRLGKNRCYVFNPADYSQFLRKKKLTKLLRQSVFNDYEGFEAYFQPLIDAETGVLYGAETLMRFACEPYGNISPAEFIPILEETGLIIPAGRWILHEALQACKQIQKYIPDFRININVSYIQIMKSDIIEEIASAITYYEISPSSVVLELTESGVLDSDLRFAKLWECMREKGVRLALDDFGTGYSNFHYLYNLKPDIIKIDRTLTTQALNNEYEFKLLSLMSGMIHSMNLHMCVEGVETDQELSMVLDLSPDFIQGYYYGKPCAYDEFLNLYVLPKAKREKFIFCKN